MRATMRWPVRLAAILCVILVADDAADRQSAGGAPLWTPDAAFLAGGDEDEDNDPEAVYESPQYGYTLTYDPAEWSIVQEDEDPEDEFDFVLFANEEQTSFIGIEGNPTYDDDAMTECVSDYVEVLSNDDGVSDVEALDGRDATGEEDGRAWGTVTYAFELEDGDQADLVRYFRCFYAGDGLTIVISHEALVADYEDEIENRLEFVEGLALAAEDDDEGPGQGGGAGATANLDGTWVGQMENGVPIAFVVEDGAVASVALAYDCNGGLSIVRATVTPAAEIDDGEFVFVAPVSTGTLTMIGVFTDEDRAEGTVEIESEDRACETLLAWTAVPE